MAFLFCFWFNGLSRITHDFDHLLFLFLFSIEYKIYRKTQSITRIQPKVSVSENPSREKVTLIYGEKRLVVEPQNFRFLLVQFHTKMGSDIGSGYKPNPRFLATEDPREPPWKLKI